MVKTKEQKNKTYSWLLQMSISLTVRGTQKGRPNPEGFFLGKIGWASIRR